MRVSGSNRWARLAPRTRASIRSRTCPASSNRSSCDNSAIRPCSPSTTSVQSWTSAARTRAVTSAYASGPWAPVQGAPHRPISASTQAVPRGRAGSRLVHCRTGSTSWRAASAASAATREVNGPQDTASACRTSRTIDSRGKASRVNVIHTTLSG